MIRTQVYINFVTAVSIARSAQLNSMDSSTTKLSDDCISQALLLVRDYTLDDDVKILQQQGVFTPSKENLSAAVEYYDKHGKVMLLRMISSQDVKALNDYYDKMTAEEKNETPTLLGNTVMSSTVKLTNTLWYKKVGPTFSFRMSFNYLLIRGSCRFAYIRCICLPA